MTWTKGHDHINVTLGWDVDVRIGLVLIGVTHLLVLILVAYLLFRGWAQFMERGRRRLELIGIWHDRAVRAWLETARLTNVERVTRAWTNVLSGALAREGEISSADEDLDPARAPMSMQVGHPRFKPIQLQRWLAEIGGQPGWRIACLADLAADSLACPADRSIARLATDQALPGGLLDQFLKDLPELRTTWRTAIADVIWAGLRMKMAENAKSIDVPELGAHTWQLDAFLGALTPADGEDAWQENYQIDEGSGTVPSPELMLSPALCTGRLRVQIDPLKIGADDGECLTEPESGGDELR